MQMRLVLQFCFCHSVHHCRRLVAARAAVCVLATAVSERIMQSMVRWAQPWPASRLASELATLSIAAHLISEPPSFEINFIYSFIHFVVMFAKPLGTNQTTAISDDDNQLQTNKSGSNQLVAQSFGQFAFIQTKLFLNLHRTILVQFSEEI